MRAYKGNGNSFIPQFKKRLSSGYEYLSLQTSKKLIRHYWKQIAAFLRKIKSIKLSERPLTFTLVKKKVFQKTNPIKTLPKNIFKFSTFRLRNDANRNVSSVKIIKNSNNSKNTRTCFSEMPTWTCQCDRRIGELHGRKLWGQRLLVFLLRRRLRPQLCFADNLRKWRELVRRNPGVRAWVSSSVAVAYVGAYGKIK